MLVLDCFNYLCYNICFEPRPTIQSAMQLDWNMLTSRERLQLQCSKKGGKVTAISIMNWCH